jgi:hypothetical protein
MIDKNTLLEMYRDEHKSMQDIADKLNCSLHRVAYWMNKHKIKIRSYSEASYLKHNPHGDPFKFRKPKNFKEAELFGLGLGLYWGEGTKASKYAIRLGNTDPLLIKYFMDFLETFFGIEKEDLQFGLQIFSDINPGTALDFWAKTLKVDKCQFYKPTVTISGSIGTYRKKSKYGVLTVLYHNTKARRLLDKIMPA